LVRINPVNPETAQEVEKVIKQGADIIMLPMFQSKEDIESVGKMIDGRVKFIPLIETKAAAENLKSYVTSPYITEFYIGLNDLHRELGHKFMFELISTGYVEKMVNDIKHVNKPFGFGGIARIGEGTLPAKLILAEHVRLGSSAVILSRAFHQRSESLDELKSKLDLAEEIEKLNSEFEYLKTRTSEQEAMDKKLFGQAVEKIVAGME
jgi:2-keto-3-deoxy-L-rhamnonate aldolase RhmA